MEEELLNPAIFSLKNSVSIRVGKHILKYILNSARSLKLYIWILFLFCKVTQIFISINNNYASDIPHWL